jgi:hypothetical protein
MTLPPAGTRDTCATCGALIVYVDPHWEHVGDTQPRHIAMPSAWVPDFPGETIHVDDISMGGLGTITAGTLPTTIRVEDNAVVLTIDGAERLPSGTVITLSLTVGPGGEIAVAPPAAVPAEKPRRYMNGGR